MNKSGFSLLEVLVATALVVTLFSITAGVVAFGFNAAQRMERSNIALNLARTKLLEETMEDFDLINNSSVTANGYITTVNVEDILAGGAVELKRITVTVTREGTDISESLSTTVAR